MFLPCLLVLAGAGCAQAQMQTDTPTIVPDDEAAVEVYVAPEYVIAVDSLVQLSTADGATVDAMLSSMISNLKAQYSDVPEDIFDEIADRLSKELKERLSQSIAEVYARYFTLDEVRKLIAFYLTPIGRKLSQKMPEMTPQLYKKGEEIGESVVMKYIDELNSLDS